MCIYVYIYMYIYIYWGYIGIMEKKMETTIVTDITGGSHAKVENYSGSLSCSLRSCRYLSLSIYICLYVLLPSEIENTLKNSKTHIRPKARVLVLEPR